MKIGNALLALVLACASAVRASEPAPAREFSTTSPSGAFTACAKVVGGWDNHIRIEVYGPLPGSLFWAASLGSSGELVTDMKVSDQGCVLATFRGVSFQMFTFTGRPGAAVCLYDELSPEERNRFAKQMDMRGGDWLGSHLKRDVWTEAGGLWVYVRTCWGHILPFNCATGDLDRSPGLAGRIEASLLAETTAWLASAPGSFGAKCPRCGNPCLDPAVIDRLFIIRTYELAEGEPVIRAALAARTSGHDDSLADDLALVYDPDSLASKARRIDFRYPLIGLILFLAGTVWFMWKRAGRH